MSDSTYDTGATSAPETAPLSDEAREENMIRQLREHHAWLDRNRGDIWRDDPPGCEDE